MAVMTPHFLQWYSVLGYPIFISVLTSKTSGTESKKDGQPVPLSYLVDDSNNFIPHPTQWYEPSRFSWFYGLLPGDSVPSCFKM